MSKPTKRDERIAKFAEKGWYVEPTTKTYRPYVTLVHKEKNYKLYLGRSSVRFGRTYTSSRPAETF